VLSLVDVWRCIQRRHAAAGNTISFVSYPTEQLTTVVPLENHPQPLPSGRMTCGDLTLSILFVGDIEDRTL